MSPELITLINWHLTNAASWSVLCFALLFCGIAYWQHNRSMTRHAAQQNENEKLLTRSREQQDRVTELLDREEALLARAEAFLNRLEARRSDDAIKR